MLRFDSYACRCYGVRQVRTCARRAAVALSEWSERAAPLRLAYIRQQLFFPDKRLIQYDCGKLQVRRYGMCGQYGAAAVRQAPAFGRESCNLVASAWLAAVVISLCVVVLVPRPLCRSTVPRVLSYRHKCTPPIV